MTPRSCSGTASARCTSGSPSTRSSKARAEYPGCKVIVHPECPMPVVDAADESGSTDYIRKVVAAQPSRATSSRSAPRSTWSTGSRREYPEHTIFCLDPVVCPCSTMYRIHPGYLAWVLDGARRRRGPQRDRRSRTRWPRDAQGRARADAGRQAQDHGGLAHDASSSSAPASPGSSLLSTRTWAATRSCWSPRRTLAESNTRYAQGGVAVVARRDDSVAAHVADTLVAGAGLCDPRAVERALLRGSATRCAT